MELHSYSKEEAFTRAVSLALFDYLRKSRAQGYVVSLSGGADSSAVAASASAVWRELDREPEALRFYHHHGGAGFSEAGASRVLAVQVRVAAGAAEEEWNTLWSAMSVTH